MNIEDVKVGMIVRLNERVSRNYVGLLARVVRKPKKRAMGVDAIRCEIVILNPKTLKRMTQQEVGDLCRGHIYLEGVNTCSCTGFDPLEVVDRQALINTHTSYPREGGDDEIK